MGYEVAADYVDVATRIVEFREKFPNGSLQQLSLRFEEFAGKAWIIYTAAAYRTPDDARPGHGTAWESVPGRTPFTRDSELQNAETAAWGRAIVAALVADAKRGIASAEEIRARQGGGQASPTTPAEPSGPRKMSRNTPPAEPKNISREQSIAMHASFNEAGITQKPARLDYCRNLIGRQIESSNDLTSAEASKVIDALKQDATPAEATS